MKNNIAVITISYPTNVSKYVGQFVKSRVEEYAKFFSVKVYVYNNMLNINYKLDKIDVFAGSPAYIYDEIKKFDPSLFVLHACPGNRKFNSMILNLKKELKIPLILNIHGFEVMDLLRFTFYEVYNLTSLVKHILSGLRQYIVLFANRVIVKNAELVVSPSIWMKKIAERSLFLRIKNGIIISNFIDEKLFKSRKEKRSKSILSVRSYDYRKYANDISVKTIKFLYNKYKEKMTDFMVTFYGRGRFFNKIKKMDKKGVVSFIPDFVKHDKMPGIFDDYKYFLCPTRTDAQGVSMCEAMINGLIPITLKNTAIPEFVPKILLNKNYKQMAELIIKLEDDPFFYEQCRHECRELIRKKCSFNNTINREIQLMRSFIGG